MGTTNLTATVRLSLLALIMGAFGAVVGTGLTSLVSAHGGDQNLVHACIRELPLPNGPLSSLFSTLLRDGDVRIVDADEDCKSGETEMDWPKSGDGALGGYEVRSTETTTLVNSLGSLSTQAECTGEKQPIGGGFQVNVGSFYALSSLPFSDVVSGLVISGWRASVFNSSANDLQVTLKVYAVCADVAP